MTAQTLSDVRQTLWEIERFAALYWIVKEINGEEPERVDGTDGLLILEIERRVEKLKNVLPAA